ncbi:p-aminobenzoyl-glutamate transport protein [Sinobacterium norvegicum]|uniref:p-aminobenzoyl-glutamate transport protein n=1 Tax=Sinobacterium norvegicum TaxID=1641715 RepID=A0ABM9ADW8_9GAMM|nr:AbgT family transporter [Sinobacterium norvegicum]CAH0991236.1 p-aminobenzoyl-glutamate transport protein [Sinobacterium norvegicum]
MKPTTPSSILSRILDTIERVGNKLPDPAILFLLLMLIVWFCSLALSFVSYGEIDPRTGEAIAINNLLTSQQLTDWLTSMVTTFTSFAPLGVVLVAMLGVGVAERSGYINAALKAMLKVTPASLITPVVALIGITSSVATDAGYVVVIPLAGAIYYAVGRHPIAGITTAFAGVSGGFCANFIPSGLDPLLQSFTQSAAQLVDPAMQINPLNNWFFTTASCIPIMLIIWFITDKVVEPRLNANSPLDTDIDADNQLQHTSSKETRAFRIASLTMLIGLAGLIFWAADPQSTLRGADGSLTSFSAPLMQMIVPLIFIFFIIPGVIFGYLSGNYQNSNDVVKSMSQSMETMGHYIVMAFFCSLFIAAFANSNIGVLMAVKGANALQALGLSGGGTVVGMVALVVVINLFVGSSSAKWALISPVLVPMLMQLNMSPDLVQAAYRVGDSSSNIITPLMPYFPLVVAYCQKYYKGTGIGTLIATMLPYSIALVIFWTVFLLGYWALGLPLGLGASYHYG